MQPIILLGVAAVAVTLIGTGFLAEPWNEFDLWVQQFGWGEADVMSPISQAAVDLNIKKIPQDNGTTVEDCDGILVGETFDECITRVTTDDYFDNIISHCSFHSDDSIPAAEDHNISPGLIICKLTDDRDLAIAEGRINFDSYSASDHLFIEITMLAFPGANDVTAPIHDVKLVVEAPI